MAILLCPFRMLQNLVSLWIFFSNTHFVLSTMNQFLPIKPNNELQVKSLHITDTQYKGKFILRKNKNKNKPIFGEATSLLSSILPCNINGYKFHLLPSQYFGVAALRPELVG